MVKLLSSLTLISVTPFAVLAHGPHDLEKRGVATCGTAYKPVLAGQYPVMLSTWWFIAAGTATPQSVIDIFKDWLANFRQLPIGFIVLQHDLFKRRLPAVDGILPIAYNTTDLVIQPIADCLGDGKPYRKGAGTFNLSSDSPSTNPGTLDKAANTASTTRPIARCSLAFLVLAPLVSL
ncbi:chitin deacetylase [Podila clonocystis]|nr:chitin deacetylase [Podila clonocystis]